MGLFKNHIWLKKDEPLSKIFSQRVLVFSSRSTFWLSQDAERKYQTELELEPEGWRRVCCQCKSVLDPPYLIMYMPWPHIWNAFIIWKESNYRLKKILWKLGTQIILVCEISETAGHEKQNGFLYWPGTRRFSRNRCTKHQGEAWTRMFKWRYHPGKRRRFNLRKLYFPSVLLLSLEMLRTIWEIKTLDNTKFPASKFRGHWGICIFSITISSDTFPSLTVRNC